MSLNPSVHFMDLGKIIAVNNSLVGGLLDFKSDVVSAVEQIDQDYDRCQLLPNFISNMDSARANIELGRQNIINVFGYYHTMILSSELPSSYTTVSGVVNDLITAMNNYSPPQTFLEDGNFHSFYRDLMGRDDVPNVAVGNTVDDSWAD